MDGQYRRGRRRARWSVTRRRSAPLPDPRGAVHRGARARLGAATRESAPRDRGATSRANSRPPDTAAIVELIFTRFTGTVFRAALALWVAAAAKPQLRDQMVPLEAHIGREVHRVVVELLRVDESVPGLRETVQATLDLGRGLGWRTC
jgi:hypothetical protein